MQQITKIDKQPNSAPPNSKTTLLQIPTPPTSNPANPGKHNITKEEGFKGEREIQIELCVASHFQRGEWGREHLGRSTGSSSRQQVKLEGATILQE